MKHTNPWETYLPVGTFRNELFYTTNPISQEQENNILTAGVDPNAGNGFIIVVYHACSTRCCMTYYMPPDIVGVLSCNVI